MIQDHKVFVKFRLSRQ